MLGRGLIGVSSFILMSSAAFAADLYTDDVPRQSFKEAPAYAPAIWSGVYFGLHAGAAFSNNELGAIRDDLVGGGSDIDNAPELVFERSDFTFSEIDEDTKLIGGLHLGYNWQQHSSPLVLGLEADVDFADDVEYLASARARVGYGTPSTLLYLTGGVAFVEFDQATFEGTVAATSVAETNFLANGGGLNSGEGDSEMGWVVGGGADFKILDNVSLGVEGLYYVFDDASSTVNLVRNDGLVTNTFESEDDRDLWQVRARLNYHLN